MNYHLTYSVKAHPDEGLTREVVQEMADRGEGGACTAVVLLSLLYPPDGSYSMLPLSKDGRTDKSLPVAEVWKAWVSLAAWLAQQEELAPIKKIMAAEVFQDVRRAMRQVIAGEQEEEGSS